MSTPHDPAICDKKTLVIGVPTRPESIEKRSFIRRSWGAKLVKTSDTAPCYAFVKPDNVIMRFFVGRTESSTYTELKEEERRFGDIVFYGLPDEYDKLHLKAIQDWSGLLV